MTEPTSKGPHVRVWQAGGNGPIFFPASVFERLSHALVSGETFFEADSLFGTAVVLRLASVTDVHFLTVESMAAAKADETPVPDEPWRDA